MFNKDNKCQMEEIKKTKVLHMTELGSGGIAKLTVSINKLISPKIQFDYLVFRDHKEFFEDEVLSYGARKQIIDTENIRNVLYKVIWKEKQMISLFKREKYDVVHVDASTPYDVVVAIAAKIAGVKKIVLHSHNNDFHRRKPLRDLFMPIYKWCMLPVVTDYFAISESAANFMFPKKILCKKKYTLIRNGISLDDYNYNCSDRNKYRRERGLENNFVIGHVGRFEYQKNHDFIIDVFEEIQKIRPNSVLLLVGEGKLENEIKEKVKNKRLLDKVIFYGPTYDVRKTLLIMDAFIFPSRFEGLGIVGIESQATGLLTFCADTIVEEVNVSDCFKRIQGWNPQDWAETIINTCDSFEERIDKHEMIIKAGYDICETALYLEKFYLQC